jgi:hypothetical protein
MSGHVTFPYRRPMLGFLNSLLDIPPQITDRSIATTGSAEFGQTGFEEVTAVAIERRLPPRPALSSVNCGGWSTILGFADNAYGIIGLDFQGNAVRRLEIRALEAGPASQVVMGDTFSLILRRPSGVIFIGELPSVFDKATKIFAKFMIAASINSDSTVSVVYAETSTVVSPALPSGEVPHTVEPFGPDGVAILAESGRLFCFPKGSNAPQYSFEKVVSVASTRRRTIFLQADGRIFEIVQGKTLFVAGIPELPIKVYAGGAHLGCVTFEGSAYAWGTGTHGQLGTGSFLNSEDPKKVRLPPNTKVLDAAAGEEHTVFTIVNAGKFAQLLPLIMMQEPIPAGIAALSALPYAFAPPEFDIKF